MATITTKITTEYFSKMNLRNATPAVMYLDELAIYPKYLSDKDSRHLMGVVFRNTEHISTKIEIDWSSVR